MNTHLKLRSVALSALLLSSLASPVFADAGTASTNTLSQALPAAAILNAATAQPVQGSIVAFRVPDLLSLVHTYAPDTVQEWSDILGRFDQGISLQLVTPDISGLASTLTISDEAVFSAVQLAVPGALTAFTASQDNLQTVPVQLKEWTQAAGVNGIIPAGTATASTAPFTTVTASDSSSAVELTASTATFAVSALLPLAEDDALFTIQSELSSAVDSSDAAAIKQALAKLLNEYKALAGNLEATK